MLLPLPPFPWNHAYPAKRYESWTLAPQLKELFQAPPPTYFSKPTTAGSPGFSSHWRSSLGFPSQPSPFRLMTEAAS